MRNRMVSSFSEAGQLLERDADSISGVKTKVEAEHRFVGSNRANQVIADVLGFQYGHIRVYDSNISAGPVHRRLAGRGQNREPNRASCKENRQPRSIARLFRASIEHLLRVSEIRVPRIMAEP